jgi:hypothetical protein
MLWSLRSRSPASHSALRTPCSATAALFFRPAPLHYLLPSHAQPASLYMFFATNSQIVRWNSMIMIHITHRHSAYQAEWSAWENSLTFRLDDNNRKLEDFVNIILCWRCTESRRGLFNGVFRCLDPGFWYWAVAMAYNFIVALLSWHLIFPRFSIVTANTHWIVTEDGRIQAQVTGCCCLRCPFWEYWQRTSSTNYV